MADRNCNLINPDARFTQRRRGRRSPRGSSKIAQRSGTIFFAPSPSFASLREFLLGNNFIETAVPLYQARYLFCQIDFRFFQGSLSNVNSTSGLVEGLSVRVLPSSLNSHLAVVPIEA